MSKTVETKPVSPTLTMIVEFDADSYSAAEVLEAAQELVEAATGSGYVVSARLVNLPSEVELV